MKVAALDLNDLQEQLSTAATVQRLQVQKSKLSSRYLSGNNRLASTCHFRQVECRNCGNVGHIAKVCRSTTKKVSKKTLKGQATHSILLQDSACLKKPHNLLQRLLSNNAVMYLTFS